MKYLLTACVLWFAISTSAQEIPVDEKTGKAYYEGVFEVPGTPDTLLYNRALQWIDEFYPNPVGVVQSKSKKDLVIEGRARFRILQKDDDGNEAIGGFVGYDFRLRFREGRYKYEIYGIRWERASYYDVAEWMDTDQNHYDPVNYPFFIEQTVAYFDDMLEAMKMRIEKEEEVPTDEW